MEGKARGRGGKEWIPITTIEGRKVEEEPITEAEMRERTKEVGDNKITILSFEQNEDVDTSSVGVKSKN